MIINICDKDGYGLHIECTDILKAEDIQKEYKEFSKSADVDKEFVKYLNAKYSDIDARMLFHNPIFVREKVIIMSDNKLYS